ncbi:hypothetical protein ACH4C2_12565 [Streptomyces sp. NPDC018057]|uniref:hypothetical protein n=1 Tax=unclassified Streptomyces TaxID=2593676 RepID=UPI00378EAD67
MAGRGAPAQVAGRGGSARAAGSGGPEGGARPGRRDGCVRRIQALLGRSACPRCELIERRAPAFARLAAEDEAGTARRELGDAA